MKKLPETTPSQFNVVLRSPLCLFLKRVKYVYDLAEFREVENPVLGARANSNLIYPWPDAAHGFPVGGLETLLDEVEVMSNKPSGIVRERTHVVERGTDPDYGFFRHGAVYKNLYMLSTVA